MLLDWYIRYHGSKMPLSLEKEAPFTSLFKISIHFEQERLGVHHALRHLADLVTGMLISPAWMDDTVGGMKGETVASHNYYFIAQHETSQGSKITRIVQLLFTIRDVG